MKLPFIPQLGASVQGNHQNLPVASHGNGPEFNVEMTSHSDGKKVCWCENVMGCYAPFAVIAKDQKPISRQTVTGFYFEQLKKQNSAGVEYPTSPASIRKSFL